jgi:hypothetical protein
MLPIIFVLYVVIIHVYLKLTPKAASPPASVKGTDNEVNAEVYSPASSSTSDSETSEKQLLESSGAWADTESSVFSRRSYSQATRHRW